MTFKSLTIYLDEHAYSFKLDSNYSTHVGLQNGKCRYLHFEGPYYLFQTALVKSNKTIVKLDIDCDRFRLLGCCTDIIIDDIYIYSSKLFFDLTFIDLIVYNQKAIYNF